MRVKTFLYRLLFTRNDDLDLLQVLFLFAVLFAGIAFGLQASGLWDPSVESWKMLRIVFYVLAIAGTPVAVAKMILSYLSGRTPPEE